MLKKSLELEGTPKIADGVPYPAILHSRNLKIKTSNSDSFPWRF